MKFETIDQCSPRTFPETLVGGPGAFHTCTMCKTQIDISRFDPLVLVECRTCKTRFVIPGIVDQYELISRIGRGGAGIVYRGMDTHLHRPAALKIIRKDRLTPEAMQDLAREAMLTARINHPSIVKVFTVGTYCGRLYVAMEFIEHGTLGDLIQTKGLVDEIQVLTIGIQVAGGLKAAYETGLIHGDVKPANILLAGENSAKIADFGLAATAMKIAPREEDGVWGTPHYIAPEKLESRTEDVRSDIYSFGATLFHAITGRPPFEDDDLDSLLLKRLKSRRASIQSFAPWLSPFTAQVINKSLQRKPASRFQNYEELIAALTHAREQFLGAQRNPKRKRRRIAHLDREETRSALFAIVIIILLCLAGAGVRYVIGHPATWRQEIKHQLHRGVEYLRHWHLPRGGALPGCVTGQGRLRLSTSIKCQSRFAPLTPFSSVLA